jgi:hypothetical protein
MWFYKCVVCCECQIEYRSFAAAEKAFSEVFTHRATEKIAEFTRKFIEMKSTLDTRIAINTAVLSSQMSKKFDTTGLSSLVPVVYFTDIRLSSRTRYLEEAPTCKDETVCPAEMSSGDQG